MFTVENLLDAYKTNDTVKNLIKDIKDNKDGVKYAYLATFADDPETGDTSVETTKISNPEKTVDSMVKRTLSKK